MSHPERILLLNNPCVGEQPLSCRPLHWTTPTAKWGTILLFQKDSFLVVLCVAGAWPIPHHTIVVSATKLHLHVHADALSTSLNGFRQIPPIMEDNQQFFGCGTTAVAQETLGTCMMEGPISPCLGSMGSQFLAPVCWFWREPRWFLASIYAIFTPCHPLDICENVLVEVTAYFTRSP